MIQHHPLWSEKLLLLTALAFLCFLFLFYRYIVSLTQEEQQLIHLLGHHIVQIHQHNMVISPWVMIAAVLVQSQQGVMVKEMVREVEWVKRLASNLGAYIDWPGEIF